MDALTEQINKHIGKRVRLRVADQDYIGQVDEVNADFVSLTTGSDNPVQVTLRTDAIDAVLVFVNPR